MWNVPHLQSTAILPFRYLHARFSLIITRDMLADKAPSVILLASASIAQERPREHTALWGDNAALQAKVLEVELRSMAQEMRLCTHS